MKKQLWKYKDIVGKKVTGLLNLDDDYFIVPLDDDYFMCVYKENNYGSYFMCLEEKPIEKVHNYPYELHRCHLISEEERDSMLNDKERKQNEIKARELEELARLKAKYESTL